MSLRPNQIMPTGDNGTVFKVCAYPWDDNIGLITDEHGNYKFDLYIIKKNDTSAASKIERSDLEGLTPQTICFSGEYWQINFERYIESTYILVFDLEDKNGNKALYSYTVHNRILPVIDLPRKSIIQNIPNLSFVLSDSIAGYFSNNATGYIFDSEFWKPAFINSVGGTYVNYLTNAKTIIKFNGGTTENSSNTSGYSLYTFYSTDYLLSWYRWIVAGEQGSLPVCSTKVMMPAYGNSFLLYYDAPCLIHTLAYPTEKLPDIENKIQRTMTNCNVDYNTAAAAVWSTKGMEYGCKLVTNAWTDTEKNSTYTAPVSEIPADFSYVVVIHFADGTSLMSDVRQK